MYNLFFSPPWYLLTLVVAVGLVVTYVANKRLDTRARAMGLCVTALAVVWFGAAHFVETPTEAAEAGTKRFVNAVVARDQAGIRRELAPEVALNNLGLDQVTSVIASASDEWGLKSITITGLDLQERGPEVIATLRVFSQHDSTRIPGIPAIRSDWQLVFSKHPPTPTASAAEKPLWQITQITPLKIGETDVQDVTRRYFDRQR